MALALGTFRWDQFKMGLDALQAYVAREGHAHVPPRHREGDFALGTWVINRRKDHRRGRLSPERVATLEGVPGWTWDALADLFEAGLTALGLFVAREGHAQVPKRYREGDLVLGAWVSSRRIEHRLGELSSDRVAALEAIPGWTWDPFEDQFKMGLDALQAYVAREGHAHVPLRHREGDFALGRWVIHRRKEHRRERLSPERVVILEAMSGWTWDALEDQFKMGLDALQAYVAREGHAHVPPRHREGDFALGRWVQTRRLAYRRGKLSPERIAALEGVLGWTWTTRRRSAI